MAEIRFRHFAGINNQDPVDRLDDGQGRGSRGAQFAEAVNVEVDDSGRLRRRRGLSRLLSGPRDSLFPMGDALYMRSGTSLVRYDTTTGQEQTCDTGLTGELAYHAVGDRLYYSDGRVARTLRDGEDVRPWGIAPPAAAPAATEIDGNLPAGAYLATMTYLSADGQESGAPTPIRIQVSRGGLSFSAPASAQDGVVGKTIYLSTVGGELLYRAVSVPNAITTVTYGGDASGLGRQLDALHQTPPPPSRVIAGWNGRLLIGSGAFLLYSTRFRYERFDPVRQSIPFSHAVTLIAAVDASALIVATEGEIWRFSGTDIDSATPTQLADYGATSGGNARVDASISGDGTLAPAILFNTPRGLCLVGAAGGVVNMTGKTFHAPAGAVVGSAAYRPGDGNNHATLIIR